MSIGRCKIGSGNKSESHLHREENANINQISRGTLAQTFPWQNPPGPDLQRQRSKQEEEVPDSPHCRGQYLQMLEHFGSGFTY